MSGDINLLTIDLHGRNLIEANAGTGKTYNITGLFTRLIVEEPNMTVESILVVTFTKAAVSDLKAKIYNRLNDVLSAMTAVQAGAELADSDDKFPMEYAKLRQASLNSDIKKVKAALRDFDQCAIFTIHGFCQRMLKENAFSGNVAYDMEMTGDVESILKKPIYDYWRNNVYAAIDAVMPLFAKMTPDDLIKFYAKVVSNQSIEIKPPEKLINAEDVLNLENDLAKHAKAVRDCYASEHDEIYKLMDNTRKDFPLCKRSYSSRNTPAAFKALEEIINTNALQPTDKIERFTNSFIESKKKTGIVTHKFFDLISDWFEKSNSYVNTCKDFTNTFKYNLCEYMKDVLDEYKSKNNQQSYDDLITSMRKAILGSELDDAGMTHSLRHKFKAALIDEFQDTDPYQYDIFNNVFGVGKTPFFMIGDPKQAIYSFRGADIFAYLEAARSNSDKHTLTRNFRSDPDLVEAVNSFFARDNAFLLDEIKYNPSKGADKNSPLILDGKKHPPVTIWEIEDKSVDIAKATARSIAELLNKAESGNATLKGAKVKASDIAVLCNSKDEMIDIKNALSACRVPAVMSGSKNVFSTDEAKELANILSAVIHPFKQRDIKTALATSIFGYTANQIANIEESEEWDNIIEKFRSYNDLINIRGFAPMFFRIVSGENLYEKIAVLPSGERKLTNLIHIAELAQTFEANKKAAPADILHWLHDKISISEERDEEAELKMDSDDNAVTIITVHKSKGLEYNIVYAPYIARHKNHRKDVYKFHENNRFIMDMSLSQESVQKDEHEERAEKIRLAYVALTRAKSACFTAWGEISGHDKSPLAYLINGAYEKYDSNALHSFFKGKNVNITKAPDSEPQIYIQTSNEIIGQCKTFDKAVPKTWQMSSFSGLIHSSHSAKDTDQYTKQADDTGIIRSLDIFTFPKGAKAGTCLHECMEEIPFENFSRDYISKVVETKLEFYSFDTDYTPAVTDNLYTIISKDMNGVKLSDLQKGDYVAEMEFQMSTKPFDAKSLADIFDNAGQKDYAQAASTLSFTTIEGFINGFADLIFCHGGKYYILDWKSNHLGMAVSDYSYDRMHAEMLSSHYYLQMHIYTLALDAYLSKVLPGYDYDTHMGGGVYIFMRGVNHSGNEGIYIHRPDKSTINNMQELMRR